MSHTHKWKYYKQSGEWRCYVRSCTATITPQEYVRRFGALIRFDPPPVSGLDRIMRDRERAGDV